jgi:hypothetical protein
MLVTRPTYSCKQTYECVQREIIMRHIKYKETWSIKPEPGVTTTRPKKKGKKRVRRYDYKGRACRRH